MRTHVIHGKNLEIGCGAANPAWEGPLWGSPSLSPREGETGQGDRPPLPGGAAAPAAASIQRRRSSARQTVMRVDSLTGSGKEPTCTRRHSVDLEIGTKASTCHWRRKPVCGNCGAGARDAASR